MFGKKKDDTAAPPESAPDPMAAHHPDDGPAPKLSTWFVLKRTVKEFNGDGCTDLAAALTYYSVLAIFPGLIALLSIIGLIPGQSTEAISTIKDVLRPLVSGGLQKTLFDVIDNLSGTPGAGIGFVVGLFGALLSASGYVGGFSRAMNKIYEVQEGRPIWRMRPMQLIVTVVTVLLCAVALVILVVSGPVATAIGNAIGVGDTLLLVWNIAKWPALAVVVMLVVAILYYATPNVRFRRFRYISIGAFVAIMVWIVASVGFAFYVATFGSYNKTYGAVAGVVVALLWIWITNVALLFGAELDAELERGRQLRLGIASEESLQLPLRDTRGTEKASLAQAKDVAKMEEIREAAGSGDPADRPFGRP